MATSYVITFMNASDSYTDDVCSWLLLLTQGGGVNSALRVDMLLFISIVCSGGFFTGGATIKMSTFPKKKDGSEKTFGRGLGTQNPPVVSAGPSPNM